MSEYDDNEMLSSRSSPSELSKRSGVRRVNNLPLYFVGSLITAFLLLIMLVGIDRAHRPQGTQEAKEKGGDTSQLAKSIAGNRTGGFVPASEPTLANDALTVPIAMPDDLEKPPLPDRLKAVATADPDINRIKQEKMQLFENAVKSKTSVPLPDMKSHVAVNDNDRREETLQRIADAKARLTTVNTDDPNTAFKTRLAQLKDGGGNEPANSQHKDLKQFDARDKDRWKLGSSVETPETPYTLRAGFVIPATLISGINSDLPGQIIGQISQDVFDTATGNYLLLPQGSRLIGSYSSDVAYGQSRVLVAWQRIIFPDGKTIDIGAMPGADGAGYSGFNDQVNNHYLRLFGSAILMSGITAGVALSQDNHNNGLYTQTTASSAMSEALGQQLGTVTGQMISKNLNISPTLAIRPGFRFNVMCIKDLVLTKPYASFDY